MTPARRANLRRLLAPRHIVFAGGDSAVFAAGQCAQSLLSHAGITLLATGETRFVLVCRTSFAPYVVDWLVDAALEYGVSYRT